jgi:hypothetical protein
MKSRGRLIPKSRNVAAEIAAASEASSQSGNRIPNNVGIGKSNHLHRRIQRGDNNFDVGVKKINVNQSSSGCCREEMAALSRNNSLELWLHTQS